MENGFLLSKNELLELLKKEIPICVIKQDEIGTGFFLEINDEISPIKRCLITCYHLLMDVEIGKEIKIEYQNKEKIIKITKQRK